MKNNLTPTPGDGDFYVRAHVYTLKHFATIVAVASLFGCACQTSPSPFGQVGSAIVTHPNRGPGTYHFTMCMSNDRDLRCTPNDTNSQLAILKSIFTTHPQIVPPDCGTNLRARSCDSVGSYTRYVFECKTPAMENVPEYLNLPK